MLLESAVQRPRPTWLLQWSLADFPASLGNSPAPWYHLSSSPNPFSLRTPIPPLCRHRTFRSPTGLLLGVLLLLVSGCEKLRPEPGSPGVAAVAGADQKVKGENPFSVAVMRQAYANVIEPPCFECPDPAPNPDPKPGPVEATHLYVRFKPATVGQLADLDSLGYRLSWEPLDESVAAVTTVDYQSADIPWVYSVVPTGTALPPAIAHEQLQELFLFTTEDGDVQDADPWEPAPEPPPEPPYTPQWDPTCQCYHQCVQSLAAGGPVATRKKGKPGKQAEATKKLKKAGVSPRALYNEAMRLSGHPEEALAAAAAAPGSTQPPQTQLFGWTRYHPHGRILVQDTDLGAVPLRGVKVESRRWFNFDDTYTDNQGNFSIGSGYLSLVKISLEFKNALATTRGLSNAWQPWQAVLPINAELGAYEKGNMENIAYTITF